MIQTEGKIVAADLIRGSLNMHRRFAGFAFCLLAVFVLSGCGAEAPQPHPPSDITSSFSEDIQPGLIRLKAESGAGNLVLVSNRYDWDFQDTPLLQLYGNKPACYSLRAADLKLQPEALAALNEMLSDYSDLTGDRSINVVAAWRDRETQESLYNRAVETHGEAYANAYIARPGGSEHHTGLAVDLAVWHADRGTSADFTPDGDRLWIYENCASYGFILRYPEGKEHITGIAAESWHFRYVGIPHAEIMAANGWALEEYIEFIRSYRADGTHFYFGEYEIWYCAHDRLLVPVNGEYSFSSDNLGGFLVTAKTE